MSSVCTFRNDWIVFYSVVIRPKWDASPKLKTNKSMLIQCVCWRVRSRFRNNNTSISRAAPTVKSFLSYIRKAGICRLKTCQRFLETQVCLYFMTNTVTNHTIANVRDTPNVVCLETQSMNSSPRLNLFLIYPLVSGQERRLKVNHEKWSEVREALPHACTQTASGGILSCSLLVLWWVFAFWGSSRRPFLCSSFLSWP